MNWYKEMFVISDDKNLLDINYIHDYLSNESYWAACIPYKVVEQSIEGSMCFGLFENKRQIGFARVITDKATFGYLADVFVDESYRGRGLGTWLVGTIMTHPELQHFRSWMLATRDAHKLYEQFGFATIHNPERFMRRANDAVYTTKHV